MFFSGLTATPLFPVEGTTVQACVNYSPLPDSTTIIVLSTESGDAGGAISKLYIIVHVV